MLNRPLVSVIVPTYRRAGRINRAVDSIVNQTYGIDQIEVVVVNDNHAGSQELAETDAKLAGYASLPHFTLVHTRGGLGGGAARNMACHRASGEYLAFLDDDDEYLPDKIESQVAFMQENGLDMAWQDVSWYREDGRLVEHRRLDHCSDFSRDGLLRAHLLTPISPTAIYMMKKCLFERTAGFGDVATGQDWWLMLRSIEAGAKMGYMPGVHVRQFLHDGERLSLGQNKIDGEAARHKVVRTYYPSLSKRDIKYIEFRHNAVLAFACNRSNRRSEALKYALRAVLASPKACLRRGADFFIGLGIERTRQIGQKERRTDGGS